MRYENRQVGKLIRLVALLECLFKITRLVVERRQQKVCISVVKGKLGGATVDADQGNINLKSEKKNQIIKE